MENDYHVFLKYLVLQMKNLVSQIKNFKIPGFLHIELEIIVISSEISCISRKM